MKETNNYAYLVGLKCKNTEVRRGIGWNLFKIRECLHCDEKKKLSSLVEF